MDGSHAAELAKASRAGELPQSCHEKIIAVVGVAVKSSFVPRLLASRTADTSPVAT